MTKFLSAGAALLMTASVAMAGGIDRSGQYIGPLFEEGGNTGSYFQFSYGNVSPEANAANIPNPLQDYDALGFAYKTQLSDDLSLALIIDQPYGVSLEYQPPVGAGPIGHPGNPRAYIDSSAITAVLRYKLDNGFSVHGGARAQEIGGTILSSVGFLEAESGYDFGYLVGGAYERPDIALRVALTYNSEITNKMSGVGGNPITPATIPDFEVETPASLNLEFQTGIAQDTLLFGSIRHVMWDQFNLTAFGQEFVRFNGDTTTYSVGIGRRLSDELSVFATLGYEAPGNRPSTTPLAPTTGSKSLGLGATYTMDDIEITAGVTYVVPGDQVVPGIGSFDDNKALGVGIRVGYNF